MIDVLVSDLGNVLLPFSFEGTRTFLRERSTVQGVGDVLTLLGSVHDDCGYGVGACGTGEMLARLSAAFGFDTDTDEFRKAWCDVFTEDTATIGLIARAHVSLRFMLSNTNELHWTWIRRRHPDAVACFDGTVVSQDVGLEKPDPAIYRHVERLSGRPAEQHLLVDDLPANVEGARACGWDGIVHTGAAHLEAELRARGLL